MTLFDGRTGEKFEQDIAVGYMHLEIAPHG